jgi:hypothetical protein
VLRYESACGNIPLTHGNGAGKPKSIAAQLGIFEAATSSRFALNEVVIKCR